MAQNIRINNITVNIRMRDPMPEAHDPRHVARGQGPGPPKRDTDLGPLAQEPITNAHSPIPKTRDPGTNTNALCLKMQGPRFASAIPASSSP